MKAVTTVQLLIAAAFITAALAADPSPPQYTNHTVGGAAGWFFFDKKNTSATNYSDWASKESFNLGDFLIFNTANRMAVVQTFNETTYRLCSAGEDDGNDTYVYSGVGDSGGGFDDPVTVTVRLTVEGKSYYFSDAGEGMQCFKGLRFSIVVGHGRGLPSDLNRPPPPPYREASPTPMEAAAADATTSQGERFYNGGEGRRGAGVGFFVILVGWFLVC
ncbi:hypothetical protein QJS04_geneDACA012604 [Acorus gramineus]|uniref:Phytocyanin domain-containing protein n=1 Tax=Acorus gramineus TaxID=55184 RepID=A0AAV9B1N4_ACOGR|nr:hypothetical protein QJS04_geneDACA012604 [Acorus gramineus]